MAYFHTIQDVNIVKIGIVTSRNDSMITGIAVNELVSIRHFIFCNICSRLLLLLHVVTKSKLLMISWISLYKGLVRLENVLKFIISNQFKPVVDIIVRVVMLMGRRDTTTWILNAPLFAFFTQEPLQLQSFVGRNLRPACLTCYVQ